MLEVGVDEITVVLQITEDYKQKINPDDYCWKNTAENLIDVFLERAEFVKFLGEPNEDVYAPNGYTNAYTFGKHSFYLAVAYHEYQMNMGIVIKFSAQALDYYCDTASITVYQFLQNISTASEYTARLSRIDLTADYIEEGINITEINSDLAEGRVAVFREKMNQKKNKMEYKRCPLRREARLRENEVQTIYLGSIYSKSRLRIYDKKMEQIQKRGTKYDKAVKCTDWVRFEASLRHEYAHQLTDALLKIQTDEEMANLIAVTMVQKYRFMTVDGGEAECETEYTQLLADTIRSNNFALRSLASRQFDLTRNIDYILHGSGTITTLFKCKMIWGDKAVGILLECIYAAVCKYIPNDDCSCWLRKNEHDYRKSYPDFDAFISKCNVILKQKVN